MSVKTTVRKNDRPPLQALETGIKETRDEAEEMEITQEQFPSIPETTRHRTRTSWADDGIINDQPQAVDGNIDDNNQDEEKTTPMLSTDEEQEMCRPTYTRSKKPRTGDNPPEGRRENRNTRNKKTPANIQ